MHRLRSTLARTRAELEVAAADGGAPPVDRLLEDVQEALALLGDVESAALGVVRVLVLDDDGRLGELTARGLRRMGFDAEASSALRPLRRGEVLVLDLGLASAVDSPARERLRSARPVVVTGASDAASRRLAGELDASDYLLKPVELEELAEAIRRRAAIG